MQNNKYNHANISKAKNLRKNMTKEEVKLWNILKAKKFHNIKFRRQVAIGNYIVDFLSFDKKVIIEIDGGQHNQDRNIEYDKERTFYLKSRGYRVIRFWNNDVWNNFEGVVEELERFLNL